MSLEITFSKWGLDFVLKSNNNIITIIINTQKTSKYLDVVFLYPSKCNDLPASFVLFFSEFALPVVVNM